MTLDLWKEKGVALDRQVFTWRDLVRAPYSKLNADAFTRIRVILLNGVEIEALRFSHACFRMNPHLQHALALVRRIEQHQATLVNWLNPADQSPLETTIGYEQVAIEVTAAVAKAEPDPYLAQVYRFGLLEDFDHLYRYSALMDRLEGKDANNILQSYTDVMPGRPTKDEHRHPEDDVRRPYDRTKATGLTKMHAMLIMAGEFQTHDYYMNVGPLFADPTARQLYAEIASIEEQHVTQYESIIDPNETWMEKWLLHEANEAYVYWSCLQSETDPRVKEIWDRFLAYELGQLHFVADLFRKIEKRDPEELVPGPLAPIDFSSQRDFVRKVLANEAGLRASGTDFVASEPPDSRSIEYRNQLNREGSPSELVATGWRWRPGTELVEREPVAAEELQ